MTRFARKSRASTGGAGKEGRGSVVKRSPTIMGTQDVTDVWGVMPFPERRACQSMANSLDTVGYRTRDSILALFSANLPAAQYVKRFAAWRDQHNMVAVPEEIGEETVLVFWADQPWCLGLYLCIQHGDCPQPPTVQPRLIGYGSPITSGYAI